MKSIIIKIFYLMISIILLIFSLGYLHSPHDNLAWYLSSARYSIAVIMFLNFTVSVGALAAVFIDKFVDEE